MLWNCEGNDCISIAVSSAYSEHNEMFVVLRYGTSAILRYCPTKQILPKVELFLKT
jgi:hypothetical protein